MVFELIEPFLPDLSMAVDPLDRRIEWCRLEPARSVLRVPSPTDEARSLQHFQVLRDRLETDVERLRQLVDRRFTGGGQLGEDRPAGRVGEGGGRGAGGGGVHRGGGVFLIR